jgi:hypothetical protein
MFNVNNKSILFNLLASTHPLFSVNTLWLGVNFNLLLSSVSISIICSFNFVCCAISTLLYSIILFLELLIHQYLF